MALTGPFELSTSNLTKDPAALNDGMRTIRSLRDIPYVDSSLDFESIFYDKSASRSCSNLSSPKISLKSTSSQIFFPQSTPRGSNDHVDTIHNNGNENENDRTHQSEAVDDSILRSIPSGDNILLEMEPNRLRGLKERDINDDGIDRTDCNDANTISDGVSSTSTPCRPPSSRNRNRMHDPLPKSQIEPSIIINEITKLSGEIASMTDYIGTWAPIAHHFVITASALQRDAAAFSSALSSLLTQPNIDLTTFVSRFYQLRSAYSSLLSIGESVATNSNFQNYNSTNSSASYDSSQSQGSDLETTWEDRQMIDSFMTLLRTSPGFLATAFAQLTINELKQFTSDEDGSPLNVLFHGVFGSAKRNRGRLFAEIVNNAVLSDDKKLMLVDAVLKKYLNLSIGTFMPSTILKLERYLKHVLNGHKHAFSPVFYACLPEELLVFIGALLETDSDAQLESELYDQPTPTDNPLDQLSMNHSPHSMSDHTTSDKTAPNTPRGTPRGSHGENSGNERLQCANSINSTKLGGGGSVVFTILQCLEKYANDLIFFPHLYNVLLDTYIGEKQRACLNQIVVPTIESTVVQTLKDIRARHTSIVNDTPLWTADELIVVKGSDIVQLYKKLLPSTNNKRDSLLSAFSDPDEEGWCLESIRADLVPVMLGISHSISKNDGWQVFKVGKDGLISDLAPDLSVTVVEETSPNPQVKALCDAIARFDGPTVESRVDSAYRDAYLRGDHATMFLLQNTKKRLTPVHLCHIQRQAALYKSQCKSLQEVVNLAGREQRREKERLSTLLDVLDYARIYIWYENEVRPSSQYGKSRELLNQLYPPIIGHDNANGSEYPHFEDQPVQSTRSKRMSILSSHMSIESLYYSKACLPIPKLTDKEVDIVISYMRKNKTRVIIRAEERFHRGLVEIANLAKKLIDRDHIPNYYSFKRDKQYQLPYGDSTSSASQTSAKRNSVHTHRRSSLGLFDLFDLSYHHQTPPPVSLHATTSTQFLGLSKSQSSLRRTTSISNDGRVEGTHAISLVPRGPALMHVQQLLLSDIGVTMIAKGTETDAYMGETGRILLDGDSSTYQPLFDDLSLASSPDAKLVALERLVNYSRCVLQCTKPGSKVSDLDIVHDLNKVLCREPGTIYGDLQIISTLVSQSILDKSSAFEIVCQASRLVLDTVVKRSMEYASRIFQYVLETTATTSHKTASAGILDTVSIYAFCAKQGNPAAQKMLADLYMRFPYVKLEIKPLTRPSAVLQGHSNYREAVASHWRALSNDSL